MTVKGPGILLDAGLFCVKHRMKGEKMIENASFSIEFIRN